MYPCIAPTSGQNMHGGMFLASTVNQFETLFHIGISHVKWLNEIISFKGVFLQDVLC